ncbi:predicted protein [Sclerotinia sclerotiorum 1980 UF-70]|uniref:Uncharacterized protein n=1 Tax=Sclerotinia sclerotiorum (strain ATCC 18683 / 1980 / Ss-1) TaxID=665079 RepID=A7EHN5_SCLS1|nr:predicted protein [Sclerotinia sclerotiorum 1980 UF-70]EDO02351.1 predicted protein [Sclerotinia sclerotiorum 1980 UF-70]
MSQCEVNEYARRIIRSAHVQIQLQKKGTQHLFMVIAKLNEDYFLLHKKWENDRNDIFFRRCTLEPEKSCKEQETIPSEIGLKAINLTPGSCLNEEAADVFLTLCIYLTWL